MFLENSRYFKLKHAEAKAEDGRTVKVVRLRRLPEVSGPATLVKQNDRLDILSQTIYSDATRFWHIADANSELKANDLTDEPGSTLNVPEQ